MGDKSQGKNAWIRLTAEGCDRTRKETKFHLERRVAGEEEGETIFGCSNLL